VGGACECGNEPSDTIKCGNFLTGCKTDYFLKADSALWSK
jgi:hypothetical protein